MNTKSFLALAAVVLVTLYFSLGNKITSSPYANEVLIPGEGLSELQIGQSGFADVVSLLGEPGKARTGNSSSVRTDRAGRTYLQWLEMKYPDLGLVISLHATFTQADHSALSDLEKQKMAEYYGVIKYIKAASISMWDDENQNYVYSSRFTGQTQAGLRLYDTVEKLFSTHGEPDVSRRAHKDMVYYYEPGLMVTVRNFEKDQSVVVVDKDGTLITNIKIIPQLTEEQMNDKYSLSL